jgi:hypothetical protein
MTVLQSFYFGRNHAGASLDTAVIAVGGGMSVGDHVPRIFKQLAGDGMERPMIALENQHVVTPLFSTICRAMSRWQLSASVVTILPFE